MTTSGPVVADASPLIALQRVGLLHLVRDLFGQVTVSPAVAAEVFGAEQAPAWVAVASPSNRPSLPTNLGAGERAAIALALELGVAAVILDDLPARRLAASRGLPVMGTVAVLLIAKRRGRLQAVAPALSRLLEAGFRLSEPVQRAALEEAGEG